MKRNQERKWKVAISVVEKQREDGLQNASEEIFS